MASSLLHVTRNIRSERRKNLIIFTRTAFIDVVHFYVICIHAVVQCATFWSNSTFTVVPAFLKFFSRPSDTELIMYQFSTHSFLSFLARFWHVYISCAFWDILEWQWSLQALQYLWSLIHRNSTTGIRTQRFDWSHHRHHWHNRHHRP